MHSKVNHKNTNTMTTKQIQNIKTVNAKSVNDLEMVLFNALEVAKRLRNVTKGAGENTALLFDIEMAISQAIVNCEAIVNER